MFGYFIPLDDQNVEGNIESDKSQKSKKNKGFSFFDLFKSEK
jgi:hypothetical protein